MSVAETFISKFHNLEGTTIGEKRKYFFQLLHSHLQFHQNTELLEIIIPQLTPKTYFEQVCFIDLLIYFHRYKEISDEFLKGNEVVVSKVSKQSWFFKKIFQENSNDFVNQYLPTLSYSLRIKVLKKLVLILKEEQSDALFDALLNRYGVFVALNILTACSIQKIEEVILNYPVKLWTSQLKILYNRKPELLYLYLEECVKHDMNCKFLNSNAIMQFVASRDPEMYCNLQEKYKFRLYQGKIGKRSTKRIVRLKKDSIIASPELFVENLHAARLVRNLGKDFSHVYLKLFTKKVEYVFMPWQDIANSKLLPHYVRSRQFELFHQTFNQVFCDPLELAWSSLNSNYSDSILRVITDSEEREKWARLKLNGKDSHWIKYLNTTKCLSIVKSKLKNSTVAKQIEYIENVTECCLLSKDWNALLEVCELLYDSNRNDMGSVHTQFLKLLSAKDVLDKLNEAHWRYLQRIIVKAEDAVAAPVLFKYFEFVHQHNALKENELLSLLKEVKWIPFLKNVDLKKETERDFLLLLIKLAPQIPHEDIVKIDLHLIVACRDYSSHHPGDKIPISEHPRLVQSLKDSINVESIDLDLRRSAFEWVICKQHNEELIDIFWKNFELLATKRLTFWFLKHKPTVVAVNMDAFLKVVIYQFTSIYDQHKQTKLLWKVIKSYSHLKMDQMVVDFCLNKLKDDDFENKTALVEPLAVLMATADFVRLVESYKPTSSKVDLTDDDIRDRFQLQRNLLKSLVNLTAPQEILPVIFHFLSGDYVASCLSPLHSSLYKYPENAMADTLNKICETGAVSIKKHGFYFICITQKETTILQALESCSLSQSVAMTYQHFVKNPSDSVWELLQTKLPKLDNNDHFTSMLLVNTPAPKNYKARYFEVAYEVFRTKQNRFLNVLVDKLQERMFGELTGRFFNIIKDDFLRMKRSDFVFSCLLLYSSEKTKFEIVLEGLRAFKVCSWSLQSHEAREKVNKFVMSFSTLYMESNINDPSLVASFTEEFSKIFAPVEAFEEHIILSLIHFKNQTKADLSRSIIDLHNRLIRNYGKLTFNIFAVSMEKIFPKFFPDEGCRFEFYCNLLDFGKITEDALLIIKLLPKEKPELKEMALNYFKTVDALRGNGNETVQLHLCRKCK